MKILIFISNLGIGGVIRQVSYLAPGLKSRGHDVSVLALYESDSDWEHIWGRDSGRMTTLLEKKPGNVFSVAGMVELIGAALKLRRILTKEKVRVLYCVHGRYARFISWLAVSTVPGTELVWGVRGSIPPGGTGNYSNDSPISNYINKLISRSVPLMIANSEAGLDSEFKEGYRCPKGIVIDNGFDTDKFKPDPGARERQRKEWNIPGNAALIGVIARLYEDKGHITFLESCSRLLKERRDVRFVCVGDGEKAYREKLEILSRDLVLDDYLIWAGVKEDIPSALNAVDVLCSPSYSEGFPNVIGEAMACGVPCVVTDAGDSARIVGDLGIVVPPEDAEMLAEGLREALKKLQDFDSSQPRRRIIENFSIDRMVDKTEIALRGVPDG